MSARDARTHGPAPRIWLLIGDKAGDNAQSRRVADCLGLDYKVKRLLPLNAFRKGKPAFRAAIDHLEPADANTLRPPWPDLVITSGRRHAMVALWIKQQNPGTQIVLIGRPRRWIERFALVIAPPQYALPPRPNVLQLKFPLMRPDPNAVAQAATHWRSRLDTLPRPLIAVLVGGPTRPLRFDAAVTRELIDTCVQLKQRYGGTLYISTSRRTTGEIRNTLEQSLAGGAELYTWQEDSHANPYLALLGLADYFVVTGDSVSMMCEVAACNKPLGVFRLPTDRLGRLWQNLSARLQAPRPSGLAGRALSIFGTLLYRSGISGYSRDLEQVYTHLAQAGFAVRAGETFPQSHDALPDELAQVRRRVRRLLELDGR